MLFGSEVAFQLCFSKIVIQTCKGLLLEEFMLILAFFELSAVSRRVITKITRRGRKVSGRS